MSYPKQGFYQVQNDTNSGNHRSNSNHPIVYIVQEDVESNQGENAQMEHENAISDYLLVSKARRMMFVRKVLGTVGLQLLFCFGVTLTCIFGG